MWDVVLTVDKLWVKWINYVYLKDSGWWDYKLGVEISFVWRKICKVNERMVSVYNGFVWII